jgi:tripartite-type tricarboxylate transporter receptor subunit TctC
VRSRALLRRASAALSALLLLASAAAPAQTFPARGLRIVVPFGPGTGSDVLARALGAKLSQLLGQPVTVDNREGAGGLIGARAVLSTRADGYTLLLAANPFVVSPLLYAKPPYDPLKDFAPVAQVASVPNVLVVVPSVPVHTAPELIAYAKANPGRLAYASSGKGTPSALEMELLKATFHVDMLEVPYKSTAQAMTDLIAGQVRVYYPTLPAALPHIRAGRVRALAVGGKARAPSAPELPTMAEALAQPGYEAQTWYGVVVAAGTPLDAVTTLATAIRKALQDDELRKRLEALDAEPASGNTEDFARRMRAEAQKWSKLIQAIGLALE